jgi:hypothetical protein
MDPEALRESIENNPDETLKKIGRAFGANDASAFYRIRQLRITYQKIILCPERDEEKWRVFTKFRGKSKEKILFS